MSDVPESNSRTADGRFAQGNPGGPGRPRKAVKAAADALDQRAAAAASDLFDVALELARERNVPALKMLLDRVWPANRCRPLEIDAPEIKHPRDLLTVMAGVTHATFGGMRRRRRDGTRPRCCRHIFRRSGTSIWKRA